MAIQDTRKKNLSEAFVNSFGAYPLGYGISLVVLPFFAPMIQKDPFTINLLITTIYATISFTRIYFLRRVFQRLGYDDNFIRLLHKLFEQIRKQSPSCLDLKENNP